MAVEVLEEQFSLHFSLDWNKDKCKKEELKMREGFF